MPSSITVLQYLPYVLPVALPAFWLLRCLIAALLGRRPDGACVFCITFAGFGFAFWPDVAPFFGVEGPLRTFYLPEDIGLRLLITGFFMLAVGLLLYAIPWLVRGRGAHRSRRLTSRQATVSRAWAAGDSDDADDDWDDILDAIGDGAYGDDSGS